MREKRSKNLTDDERMGIVHFLLQNNKNGKIDKGKRSEVASTYDASPRKVNRLWAAARKQQKNRQVICVKSKKPGTPRRKIVHLNLELIENLELQKRATSRKLADGINCSRSQVWRWVNKGLIRSHNSAIRPQITAPNRLLRLRYSIEALEFDRVLNILKFKSMHNTIHIDETEPHRTCQNKKFITKIMFMCAVCRPIFDANGNVEFDGKIGIFPFIENAPAIRKSKNRPVGTIEMKPIQSITKQVIKECLINQIVPAIKARWPPHASKLIFIQQDNARPHIKDSDPEFRDVASQDGFDIKLINQPPNSPDMNANDLGWFRYIKSIQIESSCINAQQLVNAVIASYEQLSPVTLNKVFLSLQNCMIEVMKVRGQNSYKIPHMKKDSLITSGTLPLDLEVPETLVKECIAYMLENGSLHELEDLENILGLRVDDWTL